MHQGFDDEEDFGWGQFDFSFIEEITKKSKNGCICKKCEEIFPFAEPNQSDGTLICYYCRNYS